MNNSLQSNPNVKKWIKQIQLFYQKALKTTKTNGIVLGVSGGIDSAVLALIIDHLLPKNSLLLFLNCESSSLDHECITTLQQQCQLPIKTIDLTSIYQQLISTYQNLNYSEKQPFSNLATMNLKSRLRMLSLYFFANQNNFLVSGTANQNEWYTGYFTKYGDGACDLQPLINFEKQEIILIARYLKVPSLIIDRPPSASLSPNQTDEAEMQVTYAELANFFNNKKTNLKIINRIHELHAQSQHKRTMPLQLKRSTK